MDQTTTERRAPIMGGELEPLELREPAESFEERMERRRNAEALEAAKKPDATTSMEISYRWRRPEEAVKELLHTKVLLKLENGLIVTGALFDGGIPGIFDLVENKYIKQTSWAGMIGWFPQSELPR